MVLQIEEGKYYRTRDGRKVGPMGIYYGAKRKKFYDCEGGDREWSGYIWYPDGDNYQIPEIDLVAEWKETEEMNTKCKAEELGYKKVRVTRDTCGWPVGFIGWLNPETNREVCNDDLTECWFHTLGDSCEYVGDTEDTPKISSEAARNAVPWKDMTDEEKGALLLAHYEGKDIEFWCVDEWMSLDNGPSWLSYHAYRVKPAPKEPKRETMTLYGNNSLGNWEFGNLMNRSHKITFDLIDGVPDCDSIKMEELQE